jgi:Family of unknown function (DUF6069)
MSTPATTTAAWRIRAVATAVAVAVCVVIWLIADPIAGADMRVTPPGSDTALDVTLAAVIVNSLFACLLAWLLLLLLERITPRRASTIWTITATVVFLLSLFAPLSSDADGGVKVALLLMHTTVAVVIIPAFRRSAATRRAAASP